VKVLVTGCSSGIGRATCSALVARGHEVIATARRPEMLVDLEVSDRRQLDVDSDESVAELFGSVGDVDAVVNNAGVGVRGPTESVPLKETERIFNTNVFGAIRVMQAVLPGMRERRSGTVVNVTSVAAHVALPLQGSYSATKYALLALTEAARLEVGHFGVRVLAVAPGFVDTSFVNAEYQLDVPPYDELERILQRSRATLDDAKGVSTPSLVAGVIADAIESDDDSLVWPAGADAEMMFGARESLDYAAFEAAMRQTVNLDW